MRQLDQVFSWQNGFAMFFTMHTVVWTQDMKNSLFIEAFPYALKSTTESVL